MTVETKAPPEVARKMEYCAHCGAPLVFEGYLRYFSECRPGPAGWPISVKVCRDCRGKWPQEDDTHGNR